MDAILLFAKNVFQNLMKNAQTNVIHISKKNSRIEEILKDFKFKSIKILRYEELKEISPNIINKLYNSNLSKIERISGNDLQKNDYKEFEEGNSNL